MLTAKGTRPTTPVERLERQEQAIQKTCASLLEQLKKQPELREMLTLALLVSMAVKVTPALLRAVRLQIRPRFSVEAEARLWSSPLVQSSNRTGFSFFSFIGQALRRLAAESASKEAPLPAGSRFLGVTHTDLTRAWELVKRHHASLPGVHQLQAELQWLAIQEQLGDPTAAHLQEERLGQLVASVLKQETSAIRWIFHSLPTLEPGLQQRHAALLAEWAVRSRVEGLGDRRLLLPADPEQAVLSQLPAVLSRVLERMPVAVHLDGRTVVIERTRDGLAGVSFVLPNASPLFVRLGWANEGGRQFQWIELPDGEPLRWPLPESVTTFTLHNGWGEGIEVGV